MKTLIIFVLALALSGAAGADDSHVLVGTVGPGFTIEVTDTRP